MGAATEKPVGALAGGSILSFSLERWNDVWRSSHHIMSRLALSNKVLFASSPYYVHRPLEHLGCRRGIESALKDHNSTRIEERQNVAQRNTWVAFICSLPLHFRPHLCKQLRREVKHLFPRSIEAPLADGGRHRPRRNRS